MGTYRGVGAGVLSGGGGWENGGTEREYRPGSVNGATQDSGGHAAQLGTRLKTETVRKKGGTGVTFLHRNPHVV